MHQRDRWLLACVFVPLLTSSGFTQTPDAAKKKPDCPPLAQGNLGLGTAKYGRYYNLVGRALATGFNQHAGNAAHLQAVCSEGSAQNMENLSKNRVQFAIVQSDVAHAVWYGHPRLDACPNTSHPKRSGFADLPTCQSSKHCARPALITPLYLEAIHVLIRPHLNISSLLDLKGRKIWAGSVGSGPRFSAERVLSAAGVPYCELAFVEHEPPTSRKEILLEDALVLLGKMNIDAVIFTGPVPTHPLQDALGRFPEIHFYPLPYELVQKLTRDESYTEALIRAEDYGKPEPTLTVGVEALLMTNYAVNPSSVVSLADFIHGHGTDLREGLRDLIETQKAAEHDGEIRDLSNNPLIFLRRLERWRSFDSKNQIEQKVRHAVDSGVADKHIDLTFDEKEALKDYLEHEESHDGIARLPLLDLPTPDSLVPDFYRKDPKISRYFSHPRGATWKRQLVLVLAACFALLAGLFLWMRR